MKSNVLVSRRVLLNYTREQIANILGIHTETYRQKELGKKEFKPSEINSLMTVLKLNNDDTVDIFLR